MPQYPATQKKPPSLPKERKVWVQREKKQNPPNLRKKVEVNREKTAVGGREDFLMQDLNSACRGESLVRTISLKRSGGGQVRGEKPRHGREEKHSEY